MRKFKGQKITKEKDFFTHADNFDHLQSNQNSFHVTLGDIPKDELLETAASINDDTFVKLGLRKHTVFRPRSRVSSGRLADPEAILPSYPLPTVPKTSSRLLNEVSMSMNPHITPLEMTTPHTFPRTLAPSERFTHHKNMFSPSIDQKVASHPNLHKHTHSVLLQEIIESYSEVGDLPDYQSPLSSPRLGNGSLPDLVRTATVSNSSFDSISQFSFEESIEDRLNFRMNEPATEQISPVVSNKPLPPIPVKKVSQSKYRDYELKKEMSISLDPGPVLPWSPRASIHHEPTNKYILTRTGGDNFTSPLNFEKVNQDENDFAKFTRKYSNSSSKYSNSSISSSKYSSSSNEDLQLKDSTQTREQLQTISNLYPQRNKFSPKNYKRNLTPIIEKNGYDPRTSRLHVVN